MCIFSQRKGRYRPVANNTVNQPFAQLSKFPRREKWSPHACIFSDKQPVVTHLFFILFSNLIVCILWKIRVCAVMGSTACVYLMQTLSPSNHRSRKIDASGGSTCWGSLHILGIGRYSGDTYCGSWYSGDWYYSDDRCMRRPIWRPACAHEVPQVDLQCAHMGRMKKSLGSDGKIIVGINFKLKRQLFARNNR